MTKMQEYMQKGEDYILKTYNRYPVVFEKGDGVSLYDMDGKRYLDFAAGIAVFALGYNNKEYNDALIRFYILPICIIISQRLMRQRKS